MPSADLNDVPGGTPALYEIRVCGVVGETWSDLLENMTLPVVYEGAQPVAAVPAAVQGQAAPGSGRAVLTGYLVLAGLIALYALGAARLEYLMVTGPIVFVVLGFVLGPELASVVDPAIGSEIVRVVTGVTLALLLFSDASSVNLRALRRDAAVLVMLLFVALPLAVIFGALGAWLLLPALGLATCALLASILAPTDLSLGLAMFRNPRVPDRVRREINVESGLNDGVATPVVMLFIGLVIAESAESARPFVVAIEELAIGVGIGVVIGACSRSSHASFHQAAVVVRGLASIRRPSLRVAGLRRRPRTRGQRVHRGLCSRHHIRSREP